MPGADGFEGTPDDDTPAETWPDGVARDSAAPDDAISGERVHTLVGLGRFAEAHALISDAFVERNGSAGYLLRAWVLAEERRPAEAREAVDWALALAGPGETADVFVLAGVVLLALDETHAALTVALRASGADPDGWEPSVLLSDVYRRLGRRPDAVAAARRAAALAPREAEAQIALARSLSAGRGLLGRLPRRHRTEHAAAVRRALALGADPGQLVAPRAGLVFGGVGLALFWAMQLYRMESGGPWQLAAAGAVVAVTFGLVALLARAGSRRSGVSVRARLGGIRATTRTEMLGDGWRWRVASFHVAAALPLPVLLTTGVAADRGWRGDPWPLWATVPAAMAGLTAVLVLLSAARWWYGEELARHIVAYRGLVRAQLGAGAVLAGAAVALSAQSRAPARAWAGLAVAHFAWTLASCAADVLAAPRLRRL